MTAKTHILGGLLAAQAVYAALGATDEVFILKISAAGAIGALLPDIDHVGSKISRSSRVSQVISRAVAGLSYHRGVCHTIFFLLLIAALGCIFWHDGYWLRALCIGILSHLLLDTLNPSGIMWAWPVRERRMSVLNIPTGSAREYLIFFPLLLAELAVVASVLNGIHA